MAILLGVSRNPERGVVVMYNNVDIISETCKDIVRMALLTEWRITAFF